jgi:hypothetical protein
MPKDVRPSRPESVKRTSSVDMISRASTAGGEHNRKVKSLSVSDFVSPKQQTKSSSSLAQSCNSYFHLQYRYSLSTHHRTGHATARQLLCNPLINASSGRKAEDSGGALDHFVIDRVSDSCEDIDKEWGDNRTKRPYFSSRVRRA